MKDTLEMREVYTRALEQLMKEDERVVVVEADLSRGVNTLRLRDEFPGRHIDAGIAEQDMVTISAGLSIRFPLPIRLRPSSPAGRWIRSTCRWAFPTPT